MSDTSDIDHPAVTLTLTDPQPSLSPATIGPGLAEARIIADAELPDATRRLARILHAKSPRDVVKAYLALYHTAGGDKGGDRGNGPLVSLTMSGVNLHGPQQAPGVPGPRVVEARALAPESGDRTLTRGVKPVDSWASLGYPESPDHAG